MDRQEIIEDLKLKVSLRQKILGVSCGTGITAKCAAAGGADIILALNSGRFRQMGIGSPAALMPFGNSNALVMDFGMRELLPNLKNIPLIYGLCATDPMIDLETYIETIKMCGFAGINNYPSVGFFDGKYREALEAEGISYEKEIEAIRIARDKGLFTIAFVFNQLQAEQMTKAGADSICVHFGLTKGGLVGAKKVLSLKESVEFAIDLFTVTDMYQPAPIKFVYGGPINQPMDLKYLFDNTTTDGYLGGSPFDRTPIEEAVTKAAHIFKNISSIEDDAAFLKMMKSVDKKEDIVMFIKEYVSENYMERMSFSDLAKMLHISRSALSIRFKKETGYTFTEYVMNYRLNKAREIIATGEVLLKCIPELTGFEDYAYFSRIFKRAMGMTPKEYLNLVSENAGHSIE